MNFILTSIFVFVAVTLSVVYEEKLDIYFEGPRWRLLAGVFILAIGLWLAL